ncbi:MAG: FimV/HubP family polar landmark protein [Gammaproteobacteria bacterium]|nr:FimV/HubP family polar landmark protein [Gammaproteobacteria bacterium]MDP2139226.1 FimV/HubP family polar landmark protein [Gammaproteobacteria bacterium]MDP2349005.1 FimV/HubP family polar landmark protein [Gammaproteobacteria bacterium]
MVRKLVVVFTSVVLFAAAHVKALGLGDIVVESALNQPLAARIALLQLGAVRPDQITVQLASPNDFARFSIDRESFLDSIRFNVETAGNSAYVRLSTANAVREPYLSFVLETSWPSGRLLSEHTVLLDLPSFAANAQPAPIQQAVQSQSQSSPQNIINNQDVEQQSLYLPSSLSTDFPVRLAAPTEPLSPTVADVAPDEVVAGSSALDSVVEAAAAGFAAAPAPEAAPVPEPTRTPLASTSETITIGANDTLWGIALQIRPDSSVSVQQTMLALQRLNSEAFISDNINMVRRGQVLRVPNIEQIRALSAREAISEVARQNQLFENRRNVPLTSQPVVGQPSVAPSDTAAGRGELSVVTIDSADSVAAQSTSGARSAELDARIANLENELAVQQEEADRVALQNRELTERLGLLEQQIASAQQIIRLRDLELAQLQQALAQAQVEEEGAPIDPPTVITMAPERSFMQTVLDTLIANTYALLAVTALIILMLVYVLLRRNKAAEEEALSDMDSMAGDADSAAAVGTHSEFAVSGAAESRSAADDMYLDEIFDLAEEAEEVMTAEGFISKDLEDTDLGDEILEKTNALIALQHYDEATALLQDAIVAEPNRADLRLKLLEVCVARQDAIGFKLQETELRDLGGVGVAAQIAELKSQLRGELDDEILEEGEDDFFSELSALDDMEVALDLEASADVDDELVRSGYGLEVDALDAGTAEAVPEKPSEVDEDEEAMDFDFDLSEPDTSTTPASTETALDTDPNLMDFDTLEESSDLRNLSSAFDLADDSGSATRANDIDEEKEENLLDFDFDFAVEDEPGVAAAELEAEEPEVTADDPEHSVDFDFAVLDDDNNSNAPATSDVTADDEIEFEFDEDDKELAALEAQVDEFSLDSSEFDLDAIEDEELEASDAGSEAESDEDDELTHLRFVDDEALEQAGKRNAEDAAESDEFGFHSDADETATKLDLAQAYYEMGDYEGAREILEEVVDEGTEAQIKDARELLGKL